ncbi:GNAT family N-acetyltransferase [Streptomyces goshikiensis]|uniref:GNAT family N-acetyltransferase n=1 Tax=Streptomyces goshikiensis TaxID=1942 RepID=UPI0036B77FB3
MTGLRSLTPSDAAAVGRIRSGGSMRFLPPSRAAENAEAWLTRVLGYENVEPCECWYRGIVVGADLLGLISVRRYPQGEGRLGYVLREDAWGRGHGTEAVREMCAFAFHSVGLDVLTAQHHPDNPASGRVLAKAGFTRTGTSDLMAEDGTVAAYPAYELSAKDYT